MDKWIAKKKKSLIEIRPTTDKDRALNGEEYPGWDSDLEKKRDRLHYEPYDWLWDKED